MIGYRLLGGDIVGKENALIEHMTVWIKADKGNWMPRRHNPSRLMWRNFSAMVSESEGEHKPGVVRWTSNLVRKKAFPFDFVTFRIGGMKYASKDFFAEDTFDDEIIFSSEILGSTGKVWILRVSDIILRTEKCASSFGSYAKDLSIGCGNDPEGKGVKQVSESARGLAYYSLDNPFRKWLFSIDPENDDLEIKLNEWANTVYSIIVMELGEKLLEESGVKALVGRSMDNNAISKFRLLRNRIHKILRGEYNV